MKKKKGFTLVELLVVIAILAILATVSVIGYLSFTEKANKSVDEQLCTQYNTLLAGEAVENPDITLGDFIVLVEENGINSNYFKTSSKSYVFAYDQKNLRTVLLDKDSGDILFPTNYTTDNELWTIYPTNGISQSGVSNYTLLQSIVYNDNLNNVPNLKIDLNNNIIQVKNTSKELFIQNGFVVVDNEEIKNKITIAEENTNLIDTSNPEEVSDGKWGQIIKAEEKISFSSFVEDNNSSIKIIENKFFGSADQKTIGQSITKSTFTSSEVETTEVVFNNCSFVGINISLYGNYKYVFNGCTFLNNDKSGYPITVTSEVSNFEFVDSNIINCVRSINLSIQCNSKIENSTFDLNQISTDKNERKDNAIQFNSSATETNEKVGNIVIKNNDVLKANSFIQLHANMVCTGSQGSSAIDKNVYDLHKNFLEGENVVFANNTIANGITNVQADPGMITDYKDYTEETLWNKLNDELNQLCILLDSKIK